MDDALLVHLRHALCAKRSGALLTAPRRESIRVLLVDDHQVVLRGLELALEQEGGIEVVGAVSTAAAALALAKSTEFDVALVDMGLAGTSGADLVTALRGASPASAVLVLSGDDDEALQMAALEAGATGYLLKTAGAPAIADAVRRAARGDVVFEPAQLTRLFARRHAAANAAQERPALTVREREILALMASGADTKTMAYRLGIGEHTVRRHTQNILGKLDAHSRLEAVAVARRLGLLPE